MKNTLGKLARGFFGWFKSFFGGTFVELGSSTRNIRQAPLEGGITLAIMVSRIAAMVMFVFAFVTFVLENGYIDQIRTISGGLVEWSQAFTLGTLSYYFGGFTAVAWTVVLVLSFFAIHVAAIMKESGGKRVLIVFLMAVVFVAIVIYLLFVWGALYELVVPVDGVGALRQNIEHHQLHRFAVPLYLGVLILALVAACVLEARSTLKKQMIQWLSTVLSVYLGLPLLLWFTQNLLALFAMVVFLLVVGGLLYLLFHVLVSRLGDTTGDKPDGPGGGPEERQQGGERRRAGAPVAPSAPVDERLRAAAPPAPGDERLRATAPPAQTPMIRAVDVDADVKLWKIKSATGDYIQSESEDGATSEVCPAQEFDKGKVAIMQGGGQVSYIPWKPKK